MVWKAPKIIEVAIGLEINMYACASSWTPPPAPTENRCVGWRRTAPCLITDAVSALQGRSLPPRELVENSA